MIHIQKPDGTVLTWFEKDRILNGHRMREFIIEWEKAVFGLPSKLREPKKNYYWDYAGDILKDANSGLLDYAGGVARERHRIFAKMQAQALIEQNKKMNTEKP